MRRLGQALAILAIAALVLAARFWREGQQACDTASAALSHHDELGARRAWERALRAYVPGGPHGALAVAGLWALAERARQEGRTDDERATLSALRAGLLGARSVYLPFAEDAARASRRLAVLTATDETLWWPPPAPATWALAIGYLGLATMAGAVIGLGPRALSPGLRVKARPAVAMGVTFTVGLALFMVGMRLA